MTSGDISGSLKRLCTTCRSIMVTKTARMTGRVFFQCRGCGKEIQIKPGNLNYKIRGRK